MLDIIYFLLIIGLGLVFINSFKSSVSNYDIRMLRKLFYYHLAFGVYYCFFTFGDSIGHWREAKSMSFNDFIYSLTEEKGTYFFRAFNYFPANVLDLSYFTGTMLYSLIGFIGLSYFYVIAKTVIPYNSKFKGYYLFPALFFLPNLHFWSCGVGKDTLCFFCIGMFMYGILKPIRRIPLLITGLMLAYFVRPHVALFILFAFGLAYVITSKISFFQRILFFGVIASIAFTILPSVMEFAKIEETTTESLEKFSQNKAELLSRASVGTSIDISSYPFPLKVFSFLYRPFFFDINGVPAIIASFENLLLLILSFIVIRNKLILTFKRAPFVIQGMVFFLIIGTLAFSQSLGNIGIMIRMRNMFLPGLLIFILWSFSYKQQILKGKNKKLG
ncbi:MAG: hypothetical protein ABIQ27_13260 [Flavobacterium sp.]|uniref:hypothetical protein n=1 Tax=Flavobacterium sp. TaxID=239 RepID=UPI003265383A